MFHAVVQDFVSCGHDVTASVDQRLFTESQLTGLGSRFQGSNTVGFTNGLPSNWWEIASTADATLVIAPEFSNILQTAIAQLAPVCKLLLNCQDPFLAASCDKWLTAQQLKAASVKHPATRLARDTTEDWLQNNRNAAGKWIVKPRDGAGCEAIRLLDQYSLIEALRELQQSDLATKLLLQPCEVGDSFSRSAIVDFTGRAHWLPLVTQEFTVGDSLTYCGGQVLSVGDGHYENRLSGRRYAIDRLNAVLNATLAALGQGALGWVGVDLLYSDEWNDWIVIEVNPRLTTSFTGLSRSYGQGLMEQTLRSGLGREVAIRPTWRAVPFKANGSDS